MEDGRDVPIEDLGFLRGLVTANDEQAAVVLGIRDQLAPALNPRSHLLELLLNERIVDCLQAGMVACDEVYDAVGNGKVPIVPTVLG